MLRRHKTGTARQLESRPQDGHRQIVVKLAGHNQDSHRQIAVRLAGHKRVTGR